MNTIIDEGPPRQRRRLVRANHLDGEESSASETEAPSSRPPESDDDDDDRVDKEEIDFLHENGKAFTHWGSSEAHSYHYSGLRRPNTGKKTIQV